MAFTTAMSGMGTLTAHAYTDDGAYHGDDMADGGSSASNGNDDIGSGNSGSSSAASYTAPKAADKAVSAGKETFRVLRLQHSVSWTQTRKPFPAHP